MCSPLDISDIFRNPLHVVLSTFASTGSSILHHTSWIPDYLEPPNGYTLEMLIIPLKHRA